MTSFNEGGASYRSGEMIIYDTLVACGHSLLKTRLKFKSKIPYDKVISLLTKFITGNFLTYDEKSRNYTVTGKGRLFLQNHLIENRLLTTGGNRILLNWGREDPYSDPFLEPKLEYSADLLKKIVESAKDYATLKLFENPYRDKYRIIEQILEKATPYEKKTKIMDDCNLSHTQLQEYLFNLQKTNMITKTTNKSNKEVFSATPKGKFFMASHQLQGSLMKTGKENDPYMKPEILAQIEAALSPIAKIRITPKTTFITVFDKPIIATER